MFMVMGFCLRGRKIVMFLVDSARDRLGWAFLERGALYLLSWRSARKFVYRRTVARSLATKVPSPAASLARNPRLVSKR